MRTALISLAILTLSACATLHSPPQVAPGTGNCADVAGTWQRLGRPDAANSHRWLYETLYPSMGHLDTMLNQGFNQVGQRDTTAIELAVSGADTLTATRIQGSGKRLPLATTARCEAGIWTSSVTLHSSAGRRDHRPTQVEWQIRAMADGTLRANQQFVQGGKTLAALNWTFKRVD